MGVCHSRNHFTSPPSTPTSKTSSLASFPNPIVEVTDDRLPEFISTLHLESQRNRLQDISVAYRFSPDNQVSPFFFSSPLTRTPTCPNRVDVSFNVEVSIVDMFVLY